MKSMILIMVFWAIPMVAEAYGEPIPRPAQKEEIEFACSNLNCRIFPPDETLRAGGLNIGYDVYDLIPQPKKLKVR